MSLGTWFRDYLYVPLGGNRVSKGRWFFNIFVVWMATGLWHGATWNFVIWGVNFAILLIIEKLWLLKPLKKAKVLNRIYVLFFVMINFIIFDTATMNDAFTYIKALFGGGNLSATSVETIYYLKSYGVILALGILGATPLPKMLVERFGKRKQGVAVLTIVEPLALLLLLAVCTSFLIDGSFNPFLYFRF